jgi:LAO/AO transport system kinase
MTEPAQRILSGDFRALARAATWIENRTPEAEPLLRELFPHTGRALILGITGAPGSGKSTLCDRLTHVLRSEDKKVAVLAVDPSSPYTGGALLGDRIRMQRHHADPGVFIRSMATRGWLGGLARAATEMTMLLDAAGFDVVIVETVGVGQDEVDIARLAGVTIVVLTPGSGDDVQTLKAGIMEIAQVFAINKADLPGAEKLEKDLKATLALAQSEDGRAQKEMPEIVPTVANEGQGMDHLLAAVGRYRERGENSAHAAEIWSLRLREMLRERLLDKFRSEDFLEAGSDVAAHKRDPYQIVKDWAEPGLAIDHLFLIDHLGVAVRSIDTALNFYRDQLGLSPGPRETVAEEKVDVSMLPLGGARIELLEASSPDSVIAKFIEKRGEGLHHVALKVPDLNAAVERLRAQGARLLNEPRQGAGGHTYVFVHPSSAGGVLLELIQS